MATAAARGGTGQTRGEPATACASAGVRAFNILYIRIHTFTIDGQALPYSVGANETLVLHCNENDDFTIVAKTPNA